ncbi:MAG: thiol-disulfide oxidoreductase DCC family protein [Tuberibacillus sp.]
MAAIILFDGVCNFCSRSVQFIIKRDGAKYFRFASLQGQAGQRMLKEYQFKHIDSIVLIEDGKAYVKSSAVLRISKQLNGFWKLAYTLRWIPRPIRDSMYDFVAKHRYQWFGKSDHCMLPGPDVLERFLD